MPRRRLRIRLPFLLAIAAVGLVVAGYIIGVAHWQAARERMYQPADLYVARTIDVIISLWCIWVGSSIGSFLNVVAWRMPRGETINGRSHCPRCRVQLRARDNFPIFGWLALGGRCRACRLPISPRYPIVEALVGSTLALVAMAELYQLNLPWQPHYSHRGPLWSPLITPGLLFTMLYHTVALSISWAYGLIRMDGQRLPRRLITFAAFAVPLPLLIDPTLMIVPWQVEVAANWSPQGLHVDAAVRLVTALAAAVIFARFLASTLCPAADPKLDPLGKGTARLIDLIVILSVPAIVVGWQALPAVIVIASLLAVMFERWLLSKSDSAPTASHALQTGELATPAELPTPDHPEDPAVSTPDASIQNMSAATDDSRVLDATETENATLVEKESPTAKTILTTDALASFAIAIPLALTLQLLLWRLVHPATDDGANGFSLWPTDQGEPWVFLMWCGFVLLIPIWLKDRKRETR